MRTAIFILAFLFALSFSGPALAGGVGSVCCGAGGHPCDAGLFCNASTKLCEACPPGHVCLPNPLNACSFSDLVDSILSFLTTIALALAPLMVIIGAFYLMTSADDPGRFKTAQTIFIYTGVGLLIVLMGRALVAAIRLALGNAP